MRKIFGMLFGSMLIASVAWPYGQGTEKYIPIGQSPGISGVRSILGVIVVSATADEIVIQTLKGERVAVKITPMTSIWIDQSALRITNLEGGIADLRVGRVVEAYEGRWIKIQQP